MTHLLVSPAPLPASTARIGFVVSKAVGPAVTRNLVKRRLRHLCRERVADLPPGSLLVLRALPRPHRPPTPSWPRSSTAAWRG